jgi:hypothetical protein
LTKFVLYPLCCRFFLMFPLLCIISLVVFGCKSFITKLFQQCSLFVSTHIVIHFNYSLYPAFSVVKYCPWQIVVADFFNNHQFMSDGGAMTFDVRYDMTP